MSWQLCLVVFLICCGSLLSLVDSTVYKSGVQHDAPLTSLVAAGCAPCCETPHGSVLKSQDITSCTGPYLFVGKQIGDKHVLAVGALNSAEMLSTTSTRSAPVSWSIDQSIGCTSDDELKTHSIVDTSSWTKHAHNCPGCPASALFSEERKHHGIREQEGIRGGVRGGYDKRVSIDLSESRRLDPFFGATVGKNVSMSSYQKFKIGSAVTTKLLLAAVTKTVKLITKMNDAVVTFSYVYQSKDIASANTSTVLRIRESQHVIALKRLNSVSDKMFSSNVSMFLGAPVTVKSTIWARFDSDLNLNLESKSRKKELTESYTVISITCSVFGLMMVFVCMLMLNIPCWVLAKSYAAGDCISMAEARHIASYPEIAAANARFLAEVAAAYTETEASAARTRALPAAAAAVAAVGGGGGAAAALVRPAEPTLQAAPSAPPVITVIARIVPSAQATLVSPGEAALYETAETELASSAV